MLDGDHNALVRALDEDNGVRESSQPPLPHARPRWGGLVWRTDHRSFAELRKRRTQLAQKIESKSLPLLVVPRRGCIDLGGSLVVDAPTQGSARGVPQPHVDRVERLLEVGSGGCTIQDLFRSAGYELVPSVADFRSTLSL